MIDETLFYRAFEDRYRGSRALIKQRLQAYASFLEATRGLSAPASILDLGCGRGEWLELLRERGFPARGVDLDAGMLANCSDLGLDVRQMDALVALREVPDASVSVVSAFHLVEHIPFETVRQLIAEAYRILVPGGLLLMETPNPENLVVGTANFYLDPTHERPVPPLLLSFATEYAGFMRNKVLRLQDEAGMLTGSLDLWQVLEGASPDYGVVAQKPAGLDVISSFDQAFDGEVGVSLHAVARAYESQHRKRDAEVDAEFRSLHAVAGAYEGQHRERDAKVDAELRSAQETAAAAAERGQEALDSVGPAIEVARLAETRALLAEARANRAEERAKRVEHLAVSALAHANALEARATQAAVQAAVQAAGQALRDAKGGVLRVASLRTVAASLQRAPVAFARRARNQARRLLATTARAVVRHPTLKTGVVGCLNLVPAFRRRLSAALAPKSLVVASPATSATVYEVSTEPAESEGPMATLSPHAQLVYRELHLAVNGRSD